MAYTTKNYRSKKQLVEDFKAGKQIEVYQPNADITGYDLKGPCETTIEGPHYPEPHRFYVRVSVNENNVITAIKR